MKSEKFVRSATDGTFFYVWVTTTDFKTGQVATPWGDSGCILTLRYKSQKKADRVAALLAEGKQ